MADKNIIDTPQAPRKRPLSFLWIEVFRPIIISALIPIVLFSIGWKFTNAYYKAQIQNSNAALFLKASHDLSSDDPIKCVSAFKVL